MESKRELTDKEKERNALIEQWYPLAIKLSKVVRVRGYLHQDDKLDAAIQGLFEAASHYKEGKGSFQTYASFVIRRQIRIEAWNNRNVRIPLYMRVRIAKFLNGKFVPKKTKNRKDQTAYLNDAQRTLKAKIVGTFDRVLAEPDIDPIELEEKLKKFGISFD